MQLKIKRKSVETGKINFLSSEEIYLNLVKYINIFTLRSLRKKTNSKVLIFCSSDSPWLRFPLLCVVTFVYLG